MVRDIAGTLLLFALCFTAAAQPGGCNVPAAAPSMTVSLPAPPFMVAVSKDGCWVFVSLTGSRENSGIAVLKRSGGKVEFARVVPLEASPTGITLTHDGKLLIAAAETAAIFIDVQKAIAGAPDAVVGRIPGGRGSIYANTTADGRLLFVAEENHAEITVIDLEGARRDGYKAQNVVGKIPVGIAPIALTFSPDGKWLYTTSQFALPEWNWPKACKPEAAMNVPSSVITNPQGAVIVIDVARAKTDPLNAVAARVPAGCSPVRMSMSPKGDRIYVTARNNNGVFEFDTAKLIADREHAIVGAAPVGDAPVPVMVVEQGKKIVVGNSNRFGGRGAPGSLAVLDAAKIRDGLGAVLGTIASGSFPREMAVSSDGRTLLLTNFGSNSLQVMDIARLPIDSKVPPEYQKNGVALAHRQEYKPVIVSADVLKRYLGAYRRADTGQTVVVGMEENNLTAKFSSQPPAKAIPESETKFFASGEEIEFSKPGDDGRAGQLTLSQPNVSTVFTRMDDETAKPLIEAAAAFTKRLKENKPLPSSEATVRKLIADIQAGTVQDSMFARGGRQFVERLQPEISQMGAVKSIKFSAVGTAGPDIYMVESDKGTWAFRIWLSDDGKVERAIMTAMPGR